MTTHATRKQSPQAYHRSFGLDFSLSSRPAIAIYISECIARRSDAAGPAATNEPPKEPPCAKAAKVGKGRTPKALSRGTSDNAYSARDTILDQLLGAAVRGRVKKHLAPSGRLTLHPLTPSDTNGAGASALFDALTGPRSPRGAKLKLKSNGGPVQLPSVLKPAWRATTPTTAPLIRYAKDLKSGRWRLINEPTRDVSSLKEQHDKAANAVIPVSDSRTRFDVFLAANTAPVLGRRRPAPKKQKRVAMDWDIVLSPTCSVLARTASICAAERLAIVQRGELSVECVDKDPSQGLAYAVTQQLEEFEKRHAQLLENQHRAQAGMRAFTTLKSSRVNQVISLRKSPLPLLFKDVPPAGIIDFFISVTGDLHSRMSKDSFRHLIALILKPEPTLPDTSVDWMFHAMDRNRNNKLEFSEFATVLFELTQPHAVQDTVKKLFHALQKDQGVVKECLNKHAVLSAAHDIWMARKGRKDDPPACSASLAKQRDDEALGRRFFNMWKLTAALFEEAAAELKPGDSLNRSDFTMLCYFDDKILMQITARPL
ncbi:hypothetical protein DIPPA_06454 [Diplonema papillatum]|nr:hypothetical protein DIPPA_06454 [Diplonema papillatum]|eukprot:gene13555-20876_t